MRRWLTMFLLLLVLAGTAYIRSENPLLFQELHLKIFDTYQTIKPHPYNKEESSTLITDIHDFDTIQVESHIIFIVTSTEVFQDIHSTSLTTLVPDVAIHIQAFEQIISGQYLNRPDRANGIGILGMANPPDEKWDGVYIATSK